MDTSRIHNTMDNLSQLLGYTTPDRVDEGTGHDGVDLDHCDRKKAVQMYCFMVYPVLVKATLFNMNIVVMKTEWNALCFIRITRIPTL